MVGGEQVKLVFRKNIYGLSFVCLSLLLACVNNSNDLSTNEIIKLPPLEFYNAWNQNSHGALLDIRDPSLFEEKSIWGSVNLHYLSPNFNSSLDELVASSPSKPIFVFCQEGNYSLRAAKLLSKKGVKEVYLMSGGYKEWLSSGL